MTGLSQTDLLLAVILLAGFLWWRRWALRDFYLVEVRQLSEAGAEDKPLSVNWYSFGSVGYSTDHRVVWNGTRDSLVVYSKAAPQLELLFRHFTFFDHLHAAEIYFDRVTELVPTVIGLGVPGQCLYLGVITARSRRHVVNKIARNEMSPYLELKRTNSDVIFAQRRAWKERLAAEAQQTPKGKTVAAAQA
jgi:hypothetical protein